MENLMADGPSLVRLSPQKGAVTFDDFCELLDFEDMPDEILQKCAVVARWLFSLEMPGFLAFLKRDMKLEVF